MFYIIHRVVHLIQFIHCMKPLKIVILQKNEVKTWIESQRAYQLFKKPKKIHKQYPITASFKNQKYQIDLMDMSNICSVNNNFKYILVAVDVFSRFLYCVPIKDKKTSSIPPQCLPR